MAFGMEVRAHDPYLAKLGWPAGTAEEAPDLRESLAWADAVSVHVPKTERPLLGAEELAFLKPSAILINTARGGVVEERALIDAIKSGRIAAAGLDVFDQEPPPKDHPLFQLDQVILTPHNAALTTECSLRMAISSIQNVLDFFGGKVDTSLVVNGSHANVG